jgi:hypothetical protein
LPRRERRLSDVPRTVDGIEMAWTFLALVGVYFLGRLFRRLYRVYKINKPNGIGLQITQLTMGLSGLCLSIASLNLLAGLISLTRPPTVVDQGPARFVILVIFLLIGVLLPLFGWWAVRKHDKIIASLEQGKL